MGGGLLWPRAGSLYRFLTILIGISLLQMFPPVALAQQPDSKLTKQLIEDGISAYQKGQYEEAVSKLTQARTLLPSHSPTALYLGLTYLKQGKPTEAIAAWQEYTTLQPSTEAERTGDLPKTIPQYLTLLLREENRRVAREAVTREQQIGPGDPQTIAITYYRNLGSPELGPLQKGLTALLISDISQVTELKVVERDQLQALLEELQLGTTGLVDEKTAPKVGRLLGAGKVATGSYLDASKDELHINSILAEGATAQVINTQESSGKLVQFYELEKGLAVALLANLGYDEQRLRAAGVWDRIRQPQTTSLPALTAFSQGLDAKDREDYPAARVQFEQALVADPNFELARRELLALPLIALTMGGIAAAAESSAPSASAATAGLGTTAATATTASAVSTGSALSTTTLAIVAGVVAAGAGAGAAVSASQGNDNEENNGGSARRANCGNGQQQDAEVCDPPGQQSQCPAGQVCASDCGSCVSTCGNNTLDSGEVCSRPGEQAECPAGQVCAGDCGSCLDPCTANTTLDSGEVCSRPGEQAECPAGQICASDCGSCLGTCGNGVFDQNVGELCDTTVAPTGCGPNEACIPPGQGAACQNCCASSLEITDCAGFIVGDQFFFTELTVRITNECLPLLVNAVSGSAGSCSFSEPIGLAFPAGDITLPVDISDAECATSSPESVSVLGNIITDRGTLTDAQVGCSTIESF